jgi:hypothetical protein
MKKATAAVLLAALCMMMVTGLTGCKKAPNEWYKDTLEYYRNGVNNGFTTSYRNLAVSEELKDKNYKIGYLLIDLDKDGTDELLLGLIDDGYVTKFTSVIVAHSDLGPHCLLSGSKDAHIYLCADNVLMMESVRGLTKERKYMKWNSKSNAFNNIDGEGKYLGKKWDLTPF